MSAELDTLLRLLAWERGRAVPAASHRRVTVRPDALIVCTLALAGNDSAVFALAIGPVGGQADVRVAVDPRRWSEQRELLYAFGQKLAEHFAACTAAATHPQIWVASDAAAGHLDLLADLLRFHKDEPLRRLGEMLAYITERRYVAGQQALHVATAALRDHWVTGQHPSEDHHLGALLAWIDPTPGIPVVQAAAAAELTPMGIHTDAELDRDLLEPWLERYRDGMRTQDTDVVIEAAGLIHREVADVVETIYQATQRAVTLLEHSFPPQPSLGDLENSECYAFAWWRAGRDAGYPMPVRDKPAQAALGLMEREEAMEQHAASLAHDDTVARARSILEGRVLLGRLDHVRSARQGKKTVWTFQVTTEQRVLRLRRRDKVTCLERSQFTAVVEQVRREGLRSVVVMRLAAGMNSADDLPAGSLVHWGPSAPDWKRIGRMRQQASARLAVPAWTHGGEMPAPAPVANAPTDPVADVEKLR